MGGISPGTVGTGTAAAALVYTLAAMLGGSGQPTAPQMNFRTSGYSQEGDGGSGLYVRRGSEPAHPGKAYIAGAWWEIVPEGGCLDIRQFGAKEVTSLDVPIPVDPAVAAANTAAINAARDCAKAFGYIQVNVRGRYLHDATLVFVGDHKLIGAGATPHAYSVSQLKRSGPSALLYTGSGTQVEFKNAGVLGEATTRGARFEGFELITLYGAACALHLQSVSFSSFRVYGIGHDVGALVDITVYPGDVRNGLNGGEDEVAAHNDLRLDFQGCKESVKFIGRTRQDRANVCKNNLWLNADYGAFDALTCGNSDTIDVRALYLRKTVETLSRTITTVAGSSSVVVSDATGLAVGMSVFADDIPSGSTIQAIAGSTLTLTRAAGNANARKSKTAVYGGFSTAAGRGVVLQGSTDYGSACRSIVFSGVVEPGEGGFHVLGTEDFAVASQNHLVLLYNDENNSFGGNQVINVGLGASIVVHHTNGIVRYGDVEWRPVGRAAAELRVDGVKGLGIEQNAVITRRFPAAVAFLNADFAPTADGATKTVVVGQAASINALSAYNTTTGAFTCSNTGYYRMRAVLLVKNTSTAGAMVSGYVLRNGAAIDGQDAYYQHQSGVWGTIVIDALVFCSAGDTLAPAVSSTAAFTISGAPGRYVSRVEAEFLG